MRKTIELTRRVRKFIDSTTGDNMHPTSKKKSSAVGNRNSTFFVGKYETLFKNKFKTVKIS